MSAPASFSMRAIATASSGVLPPGAQSCAEMRTDIGLPSGQITRDMRRVAKTVVFGIVYGISPFGLASNIGVSQADAKKYIETFFEKFSAVRALMDRNIEEGKIKGYTTTILGRRRPIPELQSCDPVQRGFGERMAVNSPIQGSAADLIKVAMINVNNIRTVWQTNRGHAPTTHLATGER